uniref:PPM-type phosphatase domain-containing protein n=1 Tax=Syphacia muris TaxID=451379 RepID=A0A158R576_9BILA
MWYFIFLIHFLQKKRAVLERLTLRKKQAWLTGYDDRGFLRLYAPTRSRSIVFPVTVETTVAEVCSVLGFDSIYLQIGGLHISKLKPEVRLLELQNEILMTIGYESANECSKIGDATHLTHIFCFYMGQPEHSNAAGTSKDILVANCYVRKGRMLHKWLKRRCVLYNGTIRIENAYCYILTLGNGNEDEVIILSRYRIEVSDCNRGKYLRISDSSKHYCLLFDAIGEMNLWLTRVLQTQIAPSCDLSEQRLLFLPDRLFCVGVDKQILSLNLRRNSLQHKTSELARTPSLGWLDDLTRLSSLRMLNISDNSLKIFPKSIVQLTCLTELYLSGNCLQEIPPEISHLQNLVTLNLSNNWLKTLPNELSNCSNLSNLDLSFNYFIQIPVALFNLKFLTSIQLAGNELTATSVQALTSLPFQKLDFRRNAFTRSLRITSFMFESLILHCERLQLRSLRINGASLKYLYADENELSQVIIMPIPIHLVVFSFPYNKLSLLPDWITDLPMIETIFAQHNAIYQLPYRIFMNVSSLKYLHVDHNFIELLPDAIENCSIEVLALHSNHLTQLPINLLKSAHKLRNLNVSFNQLNQLPPPNSMIDLNKLQFLRAAANKLDESVMNTIVSCRRLRVIDLSYNRLRFFDDSCLLRLTMLEEVYLSANQLTSISYAFGMLPNLQVLRLHSNFITAIPDLSQSPSLTLLDISNNKLNKMDTHLYMAKTLKHLDLTCNPTLHVNAKNIRLNRDDRSISVVDVGSQSNSLFYQMGFSETAGQKNKLCIQQIRRSVGAKSTYGIVDGGCNDQIPSLIADKLNSYITSTNPTNALDLKMGLINAHEHLGQVGERLGASALLLLITTTHIYCANVGHCRAILCRRGIATDISGACDTLTPEQYSSLRSGNATITKDNVIEGVCPCIRQLGFTFLYPAIVPNPAKRTSTICDGDEFIVIASKAVWKLLSQQQVVELLRPIKNPQIAAKKLQDTVQSLEHNGNVSVIVIRINWLNEFTNDNHTSNTRSVAVHTSPEKIAFSEEDLAKHGETTLRNIEERLERISEAISKIEDDSNNNRTSLNVLDCLDLIARRSLKRGPTCSTPQESITNAHSYGELNYTCQTSSTLSAPPDPLIQPTYTFDTTTTVTSITTTAPAPVSTACKVALSNTSVQPVANSNDENSDNICALRKRTNPEANFKDLQQQNHYARYSIRGRVELFNNLDTDTKTSRERFHKARLSVGRHLRMKTPDITDDTMH